MGILGGSEPARAGLERKHRQAGAHRGGRWNGESDARFHGEHRAYGTSGQLMQAGDGIRLQSQHSGTWRSLYYELCTFFRTACQARVCLGCKRRGKSEQTSDK